MPLPDSSACDIFIARYSWEAMTAKDMAAAHASASPFSIALLALYRQCRPDTPQKSEPSRVCQDGPATRAESGRPNGEIGTVSTGMFIAKADASARGVWSTDSSPAVPNTHHEDFVQGREESSTPLPVSSYCDIAKSSSWIWVWG